MHGCRQNERRESWSKSTLRYCLRQKAVREVRLQLKSKATITWVGAADCVQAEVRLYDRLFTVPKPGAGDHSFLTELNPASVQRVTAYVEPSLREAARDERFQFERLGYFVADREDHEPRQGKLVFNRVTILKETFFG